MKKLFYLLALATIISCSGDEDSTPPPTVPELSTVAASNITQTTAQSGGAITSNGGAEISSRGIVWSTQQNPTISLTTKTTDGSGDGTFTSSITNLTPETTYFVRAYATNSVGTAYGNEVSFSTGDILLPEITTNEITDITSSTATSGGNILSNGGGEITERGVVWSTEQNPTINLDTKTVDGSGIGDYTSNMSNLLPATSYYVRAYATNSAGTSYGNEMSFSTLPALPTLTTENMTNILDMSAESGGSITSDGGAEVTSRGVVWSTAQNPTVELETKTEDGTGIGTFESNLLNLTSNTLYYVRAYATNSIGTSYGNELTFTTTDYASLYPDGTVFCNNNVTAVVEVINPNTGKIWMDRNLGASQVATSSTDELAYGDLYQWGRGPDGHQCRNSNTTTTISSSTQPGDDNFIIITLNNTTNYYAWNSTNENGNLWQEVNGVNNPCPIGYRLPTETELNSERLSWESNNTAGAIASPLKLPMAGVRSETDGLVVQNGNAGLYWSSTYEPTNSKGIWIYNSGVLIQGFGISSGFSVRCIKN
ncbi:FISUMP domain-containing protein [Mesoflavibacter zeaxanthinifaciens]|uniref:FISUMP domain-containing protein n=1 Tax=Mesoflavibacter zeaxanthinifaciens TaxID=393060 RepID=UPI0026F1837B|nr:FISUMP domain-containing protein [Mesoflavibacter zeaxanthinifaciens]